MKLAEVELFASSWFITNSSPKLGRLNKLGIRKLANLSTFSSCVILTCVPLEFFSKPLANDELSFWGWGGLLSELGEPATCYFANCF